jgi:hypothetical protein
MAARTNSRVYFHCYRVSDKPARVAVLPGLNAAIFFRVFKERTPSHAAWRDFITIATTIPQLFLAARKFAFTAPRAKKEDFVKFAKQSTVALTRHWLDS